MYLSKYIACHSGILLHYCQTHVHVKPDIVLLADVRDGDERVESSVHCSTSGRTHEEWHKALHTHTQRYVCILYTKIYECIRIYLKHSFIAGRYHLYKDFYCYHALNFPTNHVSSHCIVAMVRVH